MHGMTCVRRRATMKRTRCGTRTVIGVSNSSTLRDARFPRPNLSCAARPGAPRGDCTLLREWPRDGTVFAASTGVEPRTTRRDGGFSLIELLLVVAIIAIIAAIALPGLMRARLAANESSAIASLRTIGSAQATFASSCGGGGFAQSLEDLAEPPTGTTVAFIPPDVAAGEKGGYTLLLVEGLGEPMAEAEVTCNGSTAGTR